MRLSEGGSLFIDFIRGVCAQLVVFGHAISYFGLFTFLHEPNFPWMQNIGVVVFFILSGFVISYTISIKREGNQLYDFRDYFVDRFSRIFSAFVPAMLVVLVIDAASYLLQPASYQYVSAFDVETFLANLFMLQDFPFWSLVAQDCCTSFGSARTFWTLAIEWWLYMFFGFLVFVLARKPSQGNLIIAAALSVVPLYNLAGGRGNGLTLFWIFGVIAYWLISDRRAFSVRASFKIFLVLVALVIAGIRLRFTNMRDCKLNCVTAFDKMRQLPQGAVTWRSRLRCWTS